MLDFDKVRKIAEIGYQQSIGPLREWAESQGLGKIKAITDDSSE